MGIAMSNALALVRLHDVRFLQNFSGRDLAWLLIGVMLAVVVMWVISRRGRRWFGRGRGCNDGAVVHDGPISAEQITRVVLLPPHYIYALYALAVEMGRIGAHDPTAELVFGDDVTRMLVG